MRREVPVVDEESTGRNSMTRRRFVVLGGALGVALAVGGGYLAADRGPDDTEDLPRMKMGDGMSKVLVVYGTKSGCTSGVAERIGAALAATGVSVDVFPAEDKPDPAGYDGVVVGSGVRVGQWHAPVKEWVAGNAEVLKENRRPSTRCA